MAMLAVGLQSNASDEALAFAEKNAEPRSLILLSDALGVFEKLLGISGSVRMRDAQRGSGNLSRANQWQQSGNVIAAEWAQQ
jgi:hypothetical protein